MRKSTLFISAALTTFMLAVLFGVVSAYKNVVSTTPEVAVEQPQPIVMAEVVNESIPTQVIPTQIVNITPEEAAAIASRVLGRTDLYSVEGAQLEGVDTYLVTFSSGDIVHIGMDGQVLSISKIVVTVITQDQPRGNNDEENTGGGDDKSGDDDNDDGEDEGDDD